MERDQLVTLDHPSLKSPWTGRVVEVNATVVVCLTSNHERSPWNPLVKWKPEHIRPLATNL